MPKSSLFSDPKLEAITINDFTPGIYTWNPNSADSTFNQLFVNPASSTVAPLGAASYATNCYAKVGYGLVPFPTYTTRLTKSWASGTGVGFLTLCDIDIIPGITPLTGDQLVLNWYKYGASLANLVTYDVDWWQDQSNTGPGVGGNLYTGSTNNPTVGLWPNIVTGFFTQSGRLTLAAITLNPISATQTAWLVMPSTTGAGNDTGLIGMATNVKVAYVTSRMVFMGLPSTQVFSPSGLAAGFDQFLSSDIQADTNIGAAPAYFSPNQLAQVGAWGSVSTGEFVVIGVNGGAVIISGDIQNPTSATLLPAVQGTGNAVGPAMPSPIGLVYATDFDGVYVWNGGNTSQKISNQLTDIAFVRQVPWNSQSLGTTIQYPTVGTSSIGRWGNWIMFPGSWTFDALTNSWWLFDDPSVSATNLQVYGNDSGQNLQYYFASPGNAYNLTGGNLSVPVYRYDRSLPSSTWTWVSTPIPSPGSLVSLEEIEICATNPTSQPATITVTPVGPGPQGQLPPKFPNQNPNQSVTFTVPIRAVGWRGSARLGFTDYNVCVQVKANAANTAISAPILHEITLGVAKTRPSGVE